MISLMKMIYVYEQEIMNMCSFIMMKRSQVNNEEAKADK